MLGRKNVASQSTTIVDGGRTALEAVGDAHKPIWHRLIFAKRDTTFDCHGIWVSIVRAREQRLVKVAPIVSSKEREKQFVRPNTTEVNKRQLTRSIQN